MCKFRTRAKVALCVALSITVPICFSLSLAFVLITNLVNFTNISGNGTQTFDDTQIFGSICVVFFMLFVVIAVTMTTDFHPEICCRREHDFNKHRRHGLLVFSLFMMIIICVGTVIGVVNFIVSEIEAGADTGSIVLKVWLMIAVAFLLTLLFKFIMDYSMKPIPEGSGEMWCCNSCLDETVDSGASTPTRIEKICTAAVLDGELTDDAVVAHVRRADSVSSDDNHDDSDYGHGNIIDDVDEETPSSNLPFAVIAHG